MNTLALRFGPFAAHVETPFGAVIDRLHLLYPDDLSSTSANSAISMSSSRRANSRAAGSGRKRISGSTAKARSSRCRPIRRYRCSNGNWNYAIAAQAHQYLVVHAAAIERGGRVAIMPGAPGAGKSTLTAALVQRGWRLLSDELALIRPSDAHVVPLARPINLKNNSIALMRAYAPDAIFSAETHDTAKGTVALMRAPVESIARSNEAAPIGWIIFPRWEQDAAARLAPWSKAAGLMEIAHNAMNYSLHGAAGFELLADIFATSGCYRFTYSRLDDAIAVSRNWPISSLAGRAA